MTLFPAQLEVGFCLSPAKSGKRGGAPGEEKGLPTVYGLGLYNRRVI